MSLIDFWSKLIIAEGDFADFKEIEDVYNCIMAVICVICAGLAAGLTMGKCNCVIFSSYFTISSRVAFT